MKNLQNKQKPDFLLDLSFVMCSCAKQPPADLEMLDTECFEYYRILKATDDNNGVFGKDSPFIKDADCKPFINIDNFKQCQSDNYVDAMLDIANYAYKMMGNYKTDSAQYNALNSKWQVFSNYAETARQYENIPKEDRNYPCVLELLDSWFNTDDKVKMSNKMKLIAEAKELQMNLSKSSGDLINALRDACRDYGKDKGYEEPVHLLTYEEMLEEKENNNLSMILEDPELSSSNIETDEDKAKAKEQDEWNQATKDLDAIIKLIKDCIADADSWAGSGITDIAVYKADEDEDTEYIYIDDIDIILEDVKNLENKLGTALESIIKFDAIADKYQLLDENNNLKSLVQNLYDNIAKLLNEISNLRSDIYENDTVTEESFLVCRCGGIIKVVQNGDWVNISKDALKSNIIDLLQYAEEYIYGLYKPNYTGDLKYSIIKAFNIVHGAVTFLSGEETELDYIIDEACEKSGKPAAHVEINVRPAQDMLKQAKNLKAFQNILSTIPSWVGMGFTLALAFQDILESVKEGEKFLLNENGGTVLSVGSVLYHIFYKKGKILKKALNKATIIGSVITAIEDFTYKSYAAFIGEINVTVTTYHEQFTFSGKYNIFGNKEGDYSTNRHPYQKSIFIINSPEDNKTEIHYKIYEDGVFETSVESDIMY